MRHTDELIIDTRSTDDLRRRFAELVSSYTPEWRFDPEQPDIGTALGLIYLNQMSDNIKRLNRLPGKYHTEFANLLGISLLPAYPSSGILVAELASDTIPGVALPCGTKLLGETANGKPVIFETVSDIYVTSARLTDLVAISPKRGKIIPIMNGPRPLNLFAPSADIEADLSESEPEAAPPPFSLFDFDADGIEKNALLLYHKSIFDAQDGMSIYIRPIAPDGSSLADEFADSKRYQFMRKTAEGLVSMDSVTVSGDAIVLKQAEKSESVTIGSNEFFVLCLKRTEPVADDIILSDLRISAVCDEAPPEFVLHGSDEEDSQEFMPFGETANLYDECYIGDDRLFAQEGADVRMRFKLSSQDKLVTFTPQQEEAELKVIKRKPQAVLFSTVTTSPEKISVEYYNGLGWKKLICKTDWSELFNGKNEGEMVLSFICPDDWNPITNGGFNSRMLRMRIIQADNCYLQPCIHTMPKISGLMLSCTYESAWKQPQLLQRACGTQTFDLTELLLSAKPFPAFTPLPYSCDALYMGLDEKPEGAPLSLLFDAAESVLPDDNPLTFEYSTINGFKPLKIIDGTKSLTRSGTILFLPPNDFAAVKVEGTSRFWLRLTDVSELSGKPARFRPVIRQLLMNAVDIRNQETMDEEAFYIDAAAPNMTFPLAAETIYTTRVYVSEMPRYSPSAMEQMARQMPDRVRITHDFFGNITSFFVLWDEAESFDNSLPTDRHYIIDRMNNTISFGDGVHVMIPQAQSGVAFTVQAVCCNGQAGNLPAGAVNTVFDGAMYLGRVYNPIATYGGSDLETVASAQSRGASIVCGRNRLVSEPDFVREVFAFSDAIEKVSCVAGYDIWGEESPGTITIAVMSRDYADGAYSFTGLHDSLKARLLSRSEATVTEESLCLCEPSYVRVSVDVWMQVENVAHSFEAQNLILDSINAFLDPLGRDGRGGWDLGVLPTDTQLKQMLHSLRFRGFITKFIVTARYVEKAGAHETDLDHLPPNPFAIAINGTHRVFMELENH